MTENELSPEQRKLFDEAMKRYDERLNAALQIHLSAISKARETLASEFKESGLPMEQILGYLLDRMGDVDQEREER